ncbi:MAG: hypothetical protein JO052_07710 [Bradyrhizobium sp.]|nr:hypothetical protein [Bradyrhizobium sp.]
MKAYIAALAGATIGAVALSASSIPASVEVVCSGNVCWHLKERHEYPPEAKVIIHEDNWRGSPEEKYEFREHEGRGYWREGKWIE